MNCARRLTMYRISMLSLLLGALAPAAVWAEQRLARTASETANQSADQLQFAEVPHTTAHGHPFVAPADWSMQTRQVARILTAPEADARIGLIDLQAKDADAALAAAWSLFDPTSGARTLLRSSERPSRNGWTSVRSYVYESPGANQRVIFARAAQYGAAWNVAILDAAKDVAATRDAQIELILGSLTPKGYERETFAGKPAHALDAQRIADLRQFIESARLKLDVPGVAIGIVQNGQVVMAEGMGVRELGKPEPVDAQTLFMIASNTKALTTLLLAKLVEAGKFGWDTPVTEVSPAFKLGDAQTTRRVQIKHLVCACTGLPRQDLEWIFEGEQFGPDSVLPMLATQQPNSEFGALYQYSNLMAGAAGYIAGQVAHPGTATGAAYDRAIQELVFDPLGMSATTFDHARARRGNHAAPHAQDIVGKTVRSSSRLNLLSRTSRPDGGAWSNVEDMLRYVQMELDLGLLPDGSTYIPTELLLARREPQVSRGQDQSYGMGLKIDNSEGTPMIHHGGSDFGFISDMLWLPEHQLGAVILTNSDEGGIALRNVFRRRLLEVLFDGEPQAAGRLAAFAHDLEQSAAERRAQLQLPVPRAAARSLAARYHSAELGSIEVYRRGRDLWFDFGGWKSQVALQIQTDGTNSYVTISAAAAGLVFIAGQHQQQRTLQLRDEQRAYRFVETRQTH